jgi:hypothetical protein
MAVAFTIALLAMLLFAALYSKCRENVLDLRERLEDVYEQRDDAVVAQHAAEAKAEHLAGAMRVSSENGFITEEDAFLLAVEADLDPELHGLAAIIGVDQDLAEVNDGPDIAEEQA